MTRAWPRAARALTWVVLASSGCAACGLTGGGPAQVRATATPSDPGTGATWSSSPLTPSSAPTPEPTSTPTSTSTPVLEPRPGVFRFPVKAATSFGRAHHDYPATDIFAACGSTVVAPADGVVQDVSRKDVWVRSRNDGATRGGLSFSIVGARGVRFYGSHLRSIAADITPGHPVRAGQVIGTVGRTGDAADVACHLHFGISPACGPGDWWTRRGAVPPYRYLKAWQRGENLSPAGAVAEWKAANGCPATPPKR